MARKAKQSRGVVGTARATVRSARDGIAHATHKAEDMVKEHPFASVAVAAAVGALVALGVSALARRSHHHSLLDRLRDYL